MIYYLFEDTDNGWICKSFKEGQEDWNTASFGYTKREAFDRMLGNYDVRKLRLEYIGD